MARNCSLLNARNLWMRLFVERPFNTAQLGLGAGRCMSKLARSNHLPRENSNSNSGEEQRQSSGPDSGPDPGCWMPHPRSGIFYPKGHEWVMEDVPNDAASFAVTLWFRNADDGVDDDGEKPAEITKPEILDIN